MTATRDLLELRTVDNELDHRNMRLDQVAALLGDDTSIRSLASRLRILQSDVDEALLKQRELDEVVNGYTGRVEAGEKRLYGGTVTNSRELQDLQADIEMLKGLRSNEEDSLLVIMDQLDQAERERDAASNRLDSTTTEWRLEQASLAEEKERLRGEVTELADHRERIVSRIPPPENALYEQVRKFHRDDPVAHMNNQGICNVCRVGVPNQLAQTVRTSSVPVRCSNCGRILLPE